MGCAGISNVIIMNDFTKEELNIIFYWAIDRIEGVGIDFFREEGHEGLYKKIDKMINEFCEHEFFVVGSSGNSYPQCHKCGVIPRFDKRY